MSGKNFKKFYLGHFILGLILAEPRAAPGEIAMVRQTWVFSADKSTKFS